MFNYPTFRTRELGIKDNDLPIVNIVFFDADSLSQYLETTGEFPQHVYGIDTVTGKTLRASQWIKEQRRVSDDLL